MFHVEHYEHFQELYQQFYLDYIAKMASKEYDISKLLHSIPNNPGVYQFYDSNQSLLYIGKAKNLRKRVKSYFSKGHDSYRLKLLVKKIADIKYIIVQSEQDALLLENNLIKEHQPKYNIQLKDDKTFPWICIKNERFPRVFSTRNRIDDGSIYFGPYTSAHMVRTLLDLIRKIYPLRTCNLNLSEENVMSGKYTTCLEYQIENCKGPCVNYQSESDYNEVIQGIRKILKGNLAEVIDYLKKLMLDFSNDYQFEEAEKVKEKVLILEKFQSKSTIVNPDIKDLDVFAISSNERFAAVNFLKIINGAIIQSHTLEIKKKLDEPDEELLFYAIVDIYQKIDSHAREVLVSTKVDEEVDGKKFSIPKIGDKRKLLDLSLRNALEYRLEKEKNIDIAKDQSPDVRKLKTLQKDLRLQKVPNYIECFDNSNIQGSNAVSACVVFRNTKPSKSEYRHYNVKGVQGPDDYATMKEVIERRYSRLLRENSQLPDLIIIDGGKGQLNAAYDILKKMDLNSKIAIIGIAKKLEEIYYPNDPVPLYLNKNSESLKVIQHARNEAHRFGINHHRGRRDKEMLASELDKIDGIGDKTKTILFKTYSSINTIKELKINELSEVIGEAKAKIIFNYFHK